MTTTTTAGQPTTPGSSTTTTTTVPAGGNDYDLIGAGGAQGTSGFSDTLSWRVETFRQQVAQGGSPDLQGVRDASVVSRPNVESGFGLTSPRTQRRTIGSLLEELAHWSKPEIEAMQRRLFEAGYYPRSYYEGTTPDTIADGVSDGDLRGAYALLLSDALLADGKPLEQILSDRRADFTATGRLARGGKVRAGEFSAGQSHTIALDDPEALRSMIDDTAQKLTGQKADPKFRDAMVTLLRQRDKNEQTRVINADEAQRRTNFDAAVGQATSTSTLDRGITPDTITEEQKAIAKQIIDVGKMRGESNDAIVAAVATGMFESHLTNLPGGDSDSEGVFQQRPSQGWKGLQDVTKAAAEFYDHYKRTQGGDAAERAADVQRPAEQYRGGYAANFNNAAAVVGSITGEDPGVASIIGNAMAPGTPDTFVPSSTVVADRVDPRADTEAAIKQHDPATYGAHEVANQYQSFRRFLNRSAS